MLESITNTSIGLVVNVSLQTIIFRFILDVKITLVENIALAIFFTIVSVTRGYWIRRWFDKIT